MKFLIDENVPKAILNELQKRNFDASRVRPGITDLEVATLAKTERRVLLTLDKDFTNILLYPPKEYYGIVCFKIHPPTFQKINNTLPVLLKHFDETSIKGRLVTVAQKGFRVW